MAEEFRKYDFTREPHSDTEVRLRWAKKGTEPELWDPLDFWIVPFNDVAKAMARVNAGEFGASS